MSSLPPSVNLRHDRPPSSERTTKPSLPAAHPVTSSAKNTVARRGLVRTFTGNQMFPPSPVVNTTPLSPATHPCVSSEKETANKSVETRVLSTFQVKPASSLFRIIPPYPTTIAFLPLVKTTSVSVFEVCVCNCQCSPPSLVINKVPRAPTANPNF